MREGLSLRPPAVPTNARNASPLTPTSTLTPNFGVAMKSQHVSHSEDLPPFTNSTRSSLSANAHAGAAKEGTGTTTSSSKPPASSSSLSNSILPRMSDPSPLFSSSAPHSESPQPMDTSRAAPPTGPQAAMAKDDTASPYGTRSRNRNGASRPNYAEDKDLDADYDNYRDGALAKAVTRQASITNLPSAATQQPPAPPRSGSGSARKPLVSSSTDDSKQPGGSHHQNSTTKDQSTPNAPPPAASSSVATVTIVNAPSKSKKRKADHVPSSSGSQTPLATGVQRRHGGAASNGNGTSHAHGQNAGSGGGSGKRAGGGYGESNLLTFEASGALLKSGKMVADDGTVLEVNDHVYLICEPPGEPYYLGRIMEFLHSASDDSKPIEALRINWYYRPKDIGKKVQDTRLVFATMHSDISPLTSLRGKCQIRHKAEIPDMAAYKRAPDNFWYERLYDRYIQKNYEVIPTAQIINVPEHVKRVLDERWKFILVEQGRGKELTSAVKTCKRCVGYCASNDSVDCAVCQQTYHMNCVKPPLLKKPSRGFAWSCAACSRAQERKLEARNTPNVHDSAHDDDEFVDDDDEDAAHAAGGGDTGRTSPTDDDHVAHAPATAEQIYHASLWPYRYLGIHCKVEDALDYDDRIFPRASTRLGPRHQAIVLPWPGRPVEYVKPLEIKKSGRKDGKLSKEMQAALEAERQKRETRPKWVQDEPPGWVQRGDDDTVTLLYKPPSECGLTVSDEAIDEYMATARTMATSLGLPPLSTNLQDVARDVLFRNEFNAQKALKELEKVPKADFKEPELTPAEQKKFEEAVAKFGSELHSVKKHVKTLPAATITRYYYTWKKSEKGKQVWGNYPGRKGKKDAKKAEAVAKQVTDDVANDHDDSAFDTDKAREKKKRFICKFCSTKSSRQWRRAPNPSASLVTEGGGRNSNKDKNAQYVQALCRRCAELWRRYAIQWEDVEEVAKKVALTGGRGWRRRVDEELYKELLAADEMMANTRFSTPDPVATASPAPTAQQPQANQEPPRKKLKGYAEKEPEPVPSEPVPVPAPPPSKKKVIEKPPPPPVPEIPKPRTLPCAICRELEPLGDQHLKCRECRLTVHRNCYGVVDSRAPGKWTCDMCLNDKNPKVSIHYKCVLCPVEFTEHDFVEPPKISHKKKTEKERERERQERENAQKAAEYYRKKQEEMNRPTNPREPLKRTADNNWVHVTCAVWTPEVKFGNAKTFGASEGIPLVPRARYAEVCKACKRDGGACVNCHTCKAPVHVECANQAGYLLGFDITPIKGSRREQHNIVSIKGESGVMSAAIWCKEHAPKTAVHPMYEVVDENGTNALQFYVQNCKQADLTLTGCARKANQITVASKMSPTPPPPATLPNRRCSTVTMTNGDHDYRERSPAALRPGGKICLTCSSGVSPKWHAIDSAQERGLTNGYYGSLGSEAQRFVEQRSFQCHKCKKAQRQPRQHTQSPSEPSPVPEPVPQVSQPPPPVAAQPSPVMAGPPEPRHSSRGPYPWSPRIQPSSGPPPAAQHIPPLQAPMVGPGPMPMGGPMAPLPVQAPPVAPPPLPPTIAPRAPPMQVPQYSPENRPYNDWSRPPPSHGPPPGHHHSREMNGGPSPPPSVMPPLAAPNHLRPPAMNSITHHPSPPMQNGHMSQPPPYSNGMPPSPRRMSGPPPPQNGNPYMSPHHGHLMGPTDLRPHHMSMNPMPPVSHGPPPQEHTYLRWGHSVPAHHQLPPRAPPHHHGSPPLPPPRDLSNPPPREHRPASGASASPSLRNLLS